MNQKKEEKIKKKTINLTEQELKNLLELQEISHNITVEFGNLKRQSLELKKRKKFLIQSLEELDLKNINYLLELEKKYGKGSIDLQTGRFNPI